MLEIFSLPSRSALAQLVAFPAAAQSWHEIPRWPIERAERACQSYELIQMEMMATLARAKQYTNS
jgi:hypothetical protein